MGEVTNEQVLEAMSEPAVTAPANTDENVSSPEVKPQEEVAGEPAVAVVPQEQKPEEKAVVDKTAEQLINLNKALSIERDEKKVLKEDLEKVKSFYEKMKDSFVEKPAVAELLTEETEQEKFEKWYAEKESLKEAEKKTEEIQTKITKQIEDLSSEWNGTDGKPKYDDAEVYKWQKDNGKTHLLPEEAFFLMKRDDIVDWKSKQVISRSKEGTSSEKPSGVSSEHTPSETKPKTDTEIRNAVLEAISSTDE